MGDPLEHSVSNRVKGLLIGAGIGIGIAVFAISTGGLGLVVASSAISAMTATGIVITAATLGMKIGKNLEEKKTKSGYIETGSSDVYFNNIPAARVKLDTATCNKHPSSLRIGTGSDSVFINNMPAARVGDKRIVCWAEISEGSPNIFIGGGTTVAPNNSRVSDSIGKLLLWGVVVGLFGGSAAICKGLELSHAACTKPIKFLFMNMPKQAINIFSKGGERLAKESGRLIKESVLWADSI